jgi:hypothetical protein
MKKIGVKSGRRKFPNRNNGVKTTDNKKSYRQKIFIIRITIVVVVVVTESYRLGVASSYLDLSLRKCGTVYCELLRTVQW